MLKDKIRAWLWKDKGELDRGAKKAIVPRLAAYYDLADPETGSIVYSNVAICLPMQFMSTKNLRITLIDPWGTEYGTYMGTLLGYEYIMDYVSKKYPHFMMSTEMDTSSYNHL